jgi:anti-anti-sigma factor
MSLEIRTKDDVVILTPRGMLFGGAETGELEKKILELDEARNEKLLVNLGKTTFMSSLPMGLLFLVRTKYVKRGAKVKLCSVDKKIRDVFELVKLTLIYENDIQDTEEEALAGFSRPAASPPLRSTEPR